MKIIAAMALNRVIGAGHGLPWNVPAEQEHYLRLIADQTVVMGRRSYEIFGEDLTSRHAVVVSRSGKHFESASVCSSLEDAIRQAKSFGCEVFINGGASIYEQAVPLVDEMDLSIIKGEYSGDAYFPEFDESAWDLAERQQHDAFEFRRYRRKA
jgi:dihydrofolate reductase